MNMSKKLRGPDPGFFYFQQLLSLFLILLALPGLAQERVVQGKVVSAVDQEPIPGVNVLLTGTSQGTVTDLDGNYTITVADDQASLTFSSIGFASQTIQIGDRSTINVTMEEELTQLNEVVVTAFGQEQEKRSLGYAVQEISSRTLEETNQPNPVNALRGRVAGVQITSSGGAPGAGSNILIRGINSLNPGADNQPLFVVDGIPISNNTDNFGGSGGERFQNTNRFADINPDDIASINILKGPAASALYGLRAANGAVIITTKSGQAGKARFNFKTSYSFDDVVRKPPMQEIFGNGNNGRFYFPTADGDNNPHPNTFGPLIQGETPVYDQFDQLFQTGHQLQNTLTYSGGSENATYYTSLSNFQQTGVLPNSDYSRTTVKISGSLQANDKLKLDGSASYINSGGVNPDGGIFSGSIFYAMQHTNTFDMSDFLNPDGTQNVYDGFIDNPIYFTNNAYLEDDVNRFIGYVGADYQVLDWLNINYKIGLDEYTDSRFRVATPGLLISRQGAITEQVISYRELNSNLFVKAEKSFENGFNGSLLLGNQITRINTSSLSTTGTEYIVPGLNSINNLTTYTTRNSPTERNLVGFFADAQLNYQNTVYLNLTARNDISSTLPADNRSFFYPSISMGYVWSETLGLNNNPVFNYGKLRLSYAEVGKDASAYQIGRYFQTYRAFDGVAGIRRSIRFGSESLRPERTSGYEFGLDLHFFSSRVTLDANYAIQTSTDQIIPVPVSYATGFDEYITNAGEIRNNAIELLLNADLATSDNFSWRTSINWSKVDGEVLSMPPGVNEIIFNPASPWVKQIIKEGGQPGDWYGWPLSTVQDPESDYYGELLIMPDGFPDVNNGKPLAENELIGNAFPDWEGGINNTISWKGLSLSFLFTFRQGGDVFDITRWRRYYTGTGSETEMRYQQVVFNGVQNVGTEENPQYEPNETPVEITPDNLYRNAFNYRLASQFNGFQDGSWIRLQNLNLRYDLPGSLIDNTFFTGISASITANNLWVTTPFVGFDPEGSTYGAGSNAYGYVGTNVPATRNIYLGLNFTF